MDNIEVVERRMRAHPAFTGGPADEGYWLDAMQCTLASLGRYDAMVELRVDGLEQSPEGIEWHIAASSRAGFHWDVLDTLARRLWTGGKGLPPKLTAWWLDATTGVTKKPSRGGRHDRSNTMRDAIIVTTINAIHDVTDLPYDFDETSKPGRAPRTACHSVAERLGKSYATVRSIWRKSRFLVDHAREIGRIPPARKRQRRTS